MSKLMTFVKPPINPFTLHQLQSLLTMTTTTSSLSQPPNAITPVNQDQLLRVCTILYQQQHSSDSRLHHNLTKCGFHLTHEFFLQVCNKFSYTWRPVYNFFKFTETIPHFKQTRTTFNKMVDVIGKSRNIDLFCYFLKETVHRQLATDRTYLIALKTLASARELKKCIEFFHFMNENGYEYNVETLNKVVETLCKSKLVVEAKHVVFKLKEQWIKPNDVTYKWLIYGFCDVGDLIEASKVWNLMADEGFDPDVVTIDTMMETLFKTNRFDEAMTFFRAIKVKRTDDLGLSTYRLAINWMCRRGKLNHAQLMHNEMHKRGIQVDNKTISSLVYGVLSRGKVEEAYKIVEGIEKPDISVYHGLIKGLLKLRRAGEATQVFREMIRIGCEPIMHTYIMLLQGHLGKRGRKGTNPLVNFDTIFVGGLVKAGKSLEATKYVERVMNKEAEVPRFDYNRFLYYFSNEEGVVMFGAMAKKLREVGHFDLADILERYGEKMTTRDRRINRTQAPLKASVDTI